MMMKTLVVCCVFLFMFPMILHAESIKEYPQNGIGLNPSSSHRVFIEEAVIVPDSDPFFSIIATSIACWYDQSTNTTGLFPLLVQQKGQLSKQQTRFLDEYLVLKNKTLLVLGESINTIFTTHEILGSPVDVSLILASQIFYETATVLIVPYTAPDAYQLSLIAAPLASYLNIPILLFDDNQADIQEVCTTLQVSQAVVIGNMSIALENISIIHLGSEEEIQNQIVVVIKQLFGVINYITMTNPADTNIPCSIDSSEQNVMKHFFNIQMTILGKTLHLQGTDTHQYIFSVPNGVNQITAAAKVQLKDSPLLEKISIGKPIVYLFLYDRDGNIAAYANSFGYAPGKTYLKTLACNAPGNYTLVVQVYRGIQGGFFTQRGFSFVNNDVEIIVNISQFEQAHQPLVPNLSLLASYLTAAHGGLIIADSRFELTDSSYVSAASGLGTGPWYTESLHSYTNKKVNYCVDRLNQTLVLLDEFDLLERYLSGPAWLALLADTTMIPMYYYSPSQQGLQEKGLPSDNPYSLGDRLSVGRILCWDVQDVSVLLCRTLFYEELCGEPNDSDSWFTRFSFICGEGFSETGGIFHQIPYAQEIKQYGFDPRFYGDFRNSRQITTFLKAYTGANYIEYLGHGDWFWFPPALYGFDTFSRAVDVAHAQNWVYEKPSVFLSAACLMGRVDGIPAEMNIGLTMLHAGCNAFVGATRETGQESGLSTLENHLIVDNWSIGEALRGEKQVDHELPTYYVRTLYGDPSFNPYEPNNGYSTQGRPQFIDE